MITVTKRNKDELALRSHYAYRNELRNLPQSYFDFSSKVWVIPNESLSALLEQFDGRLYFKTPLWKLKGEKEPPKVEKSLYYSEKELPKLSLDLYDYQKAGVQFMIDRILKYGFVLNADGVGLGKTAQSIATIKWFMQNKGIKKILVICKKSIKHQWGREITKFTGDIPTFITGVMKKAREKAYSEMASSEEGLLVTNYHNYLHDSELIKETGFEFVVVDEVHSLKTHTGKMNNNITDVVQGKPIIFLTGTPIMSRPSDIFGIVQMADKDYFGAYKEFEERYLDIEYGIYGKQIIGGHNLNELNDKIQKFMIRRTEDDVSIDLPTVVVDEIKCEMDGVQSELNFQIALKTDELTAKKEKLLEEGYSPTSPEFEELLDKEKQFLAAKQFIADDPRCFAILQNTYFAKDAALKIPDNYKMSNKTETTIELVEDIVNSERKVIIFTHFKTAALMLAEDIEKKTKQKVLMYTGGQSEIARERTIELFQNSDEYNILIGNEACAEGLNLQCANYIINYEQADTFAQREQRIGRIRRVGSKYNVSHVYDILTEHSFDEVKMFKLRRDKDISDLLISEGA